VSDPRKRPPTTHGTAGYADLWEVSVRIARGLIGRRTWLAADAEDLASHALERLARAARREEIRNDEAFLTRVIQNRILDLAISRDAEQARLALVHDEHPVQQLAGGHSEPREVRRRGSQQRGLSLEVIQKEERDMVLLRAAATVAVMPDEWDRAVLADRFYSDTPMTITELARRHGKTPQVMANYLASVLGTPEQPGAVAPVRTMLDELSLRQATAFVRVLIQHHDDLGVVTDPFAAAHGHLELASTRSAQHRRDATEAIARLTWLRQHLPDSRGRPNKILRRLALFACLYVIEERDANDDRHDPRGLADDVAVLKAARATLVRHAPKPRSDAKRKQ